MIRILQKQSLFIHYIYILYTLIVFPINIQVCVTIESTNDEYHVVQNDRGEIAAGAEHLWNRVPILRMIRIVTLPCEIIRVDIAAGNINFYGASDFCAKISMEYIPKKFQNVFTLLIEIFSKTFSKKIFIKRWELQKFRERFF